VERVWVAICDHFEPLGYGASNSLASERVDVWRKHWPEIASRYSDSEGHPPQYTFFYPEEEYRPEFIEPLAEMTRSGIADVEIHIHHDGEGRQNFIDRMSRFREILFDRHGLLRRAADGKITFAFIHGNWCLDNSGRGGRGCGLNDEISLLRDLGCYADFTMPSGAHPSQARMLNQIYWAVDDPQKPKSYDTGVVFDPRSEFRGDLLMIPGPFGFQIRPSGKPMLEIGDVAGYMDLYEGRVSGWLDFAPRLGGDVFLKLFTHGAQERTSKLYFGEARFLDRLFSYLDVATQRRGISLRYVTAWRMRQALSMWGVMRGQSGNI